MSAFTPPNESSSELYDREQIVKALYLYHNRNPKGCFEIRALNVERGGTASGYFRGNDPKDAGVAADAIIQNLNGRCSAVFFTLNAVKLDCSARSPQEIKLWAKNTTTDKEISRRLWLPIDYDAVRPAGISSTNAEHDAALAKAIEVAEYLEREFAFPRPIQSDSGNGAHSNFAVDLPNTVGNTELIKNFLSALARKFDDKRVKVDSTVYNAARIWKLPGTLVCKGGNLPERPHRMSRLLDAPASNQIVTVDKMAAVVKALSIRAKVFAIRGKKSAGGGNKQNGTTPRRTITWDDLKDKFTDRITKDETRADGTRVIGIKGCPYSETDHADDRAGFFTIFKNGSIAPGCKHNHCQGKKLLDCLMVYAPDLAADQVTPHSWDEIKEDIRECVTVDDVNADGLLLRIPAEKLKQVQEELCEAGLWTAATVEWLITVGVYRNHFACDDGRAVYHYGQGTYHGQGADRIQKLTKLVVDEHSWTTYLANEVIERIRVDAPQLWERPPLDVINLMNGLLDTKSRKLRPHSPKHLSTIQLPVSFNRKSRCPRWRKQSTETFPPDVVKAGVVWQIVAWLMVPYISLEKALLLVGPGGTGKSLFLAILRAFLGGRSNTTAMSLHQIENDRFAASRLLGKLANIFADLPATHLESTSVFRAMTGGGEDTITVQHKFKPLFDLKSFARGVFSANTLPQAKDATDAFFQRWYVIPMNHVYRGTDQQTDFAELCESLTTPEELSGVLNLALAALPTVLKNGLGVTPTMIAALEEFQQMTDPFAIWVKREVIDDDKSFVEKSKVYERYVADMHLKGLDVMTETAFFTRFKAIKKDGKRTIVTKDSNGKKEINRPMVYLQMKLRPFIEEPRRRPGKRSFAR